MANHTVSFKCTRHSLVVLTHVSFPSSFAALPPTRNEQTSPPVSGRLPRFFATPTDLFAQDESGMKVK